jgi:Mlc titration factor MtfA (ptsG expression regulator)
VIFGRRRAKRRADLLAQPFPEGWRDWLIDACDHYARLPSGPRRAFEDALRIFVGEKRVTGIEVEVTDELRLLVASSAVSLSLAWPDYDWSQLTEVLLYPDDFDRDYTFGGDERSGETHPWGTVILSVPSLYESFEYPDDAFHVGYHEFAHLLDAERAGFDGIPPGLARGPEREWVRLAEQAMEGMRGPGPTVIDRYGAHDPVEFFAVAVEAFFERPRALRKRHPAIYASFAEYFGQDPAAWDDARPRD